MNNVTVRVREVAAGYHITLTVGEPGTPGMQIAPAVTVPNDLWVDISINDAREPRKDGVFIKALGKILGKILFPKEILNEWQRLPDPIRTYLDLDPKLDDLPWEAALFPDDLGVFHDVSRTVVRYVRPSRKSVPSQKPDRPRMVVVVSVNPADAVIGANKEIRALRTAIRAVDRLVELHVLINPPATKIYNELKTQPAIFHFIGHGEAGELKLWNGLQYEPWSRGTIEQALKNTQAAPALTILNCCRGKDGKTEAAGASVRLSWSIARTFADAGSGAVVAMQGPISGEACRALTELFYCKIATGTPLDAALAETRFQCFSDTNLPVESHLPALVVTGPPDPLLDTGEFADSQEWAGCEVLTPPLQYFVDRESSRWDLFDHRAGQNRHRVLVLHGESGIGKTWLLAWCMDGWLRRKKWVRYISLRGCKDWLSFVRRLRDGNGAVGKVSEPLPPAAVEDINRRLHLLAKGGTIQGLSEEAGPLPDDAGDWEDLKGMAPDMPRLFLPSLVDLLERHAHPSPFVLVLDEFKEGKQHFPKEHFQYLTTHLFPAVAKSKHVCVILAMSDDDFKDHGDLLPVAAGRISASRFSMDDQADYAEILYQLRFNKEFPETLKPGLLKAAKRQARTGADLKSMLQTYFDIANLEGL